MTELNLKSTTIEKGLDLLKGFLERAIGPSIDEYGLILQDKVKLRRLKNQINIFEKAKQIAEKKGIDVKQINLKALFPLLEGIALEEEKALQDMWANLFVNYIDSNKNLNSNVYPSILSQISTHEVEILKYMLANKFTLSTRDESLMINTDIEWSDEELANLCRLGLIKGFGRSIKRGIFEKYKLDIFAEVFMNACTQ